MLIGLTGSIGSGKSTVCEIIKNYSIDFLLVDCDKIVHDLLAYDKEIIDKVNLKFGLSSCNQGINRSELGMIVFHDDQKKKELEDIIHPIVINKIKEYLNDERMVFVEVPLLFEAKMENLFKYIITVVSNLSLQVERLMARMNISSEEAINRINKQIPIEEKIKKSDYVIMNNGNIEELKDNTITVIEKIINNK